jgi:hypothetical protein
MTATFDGTQIDADHRDTFLSGQEGVPTQRQEINRGYGVWSGERPGAAVTRPFPLELVVGRGAVPGPDA